MKVHYHDKYKNKKRKQVYIQFKDGLRGRLSQKENVYIQYIYDS